MKLILLLTIIISSKASYGNCNLKSIGVLTDKTGDLKPEEVENKITEKRIHNSQFNLNAGYLTGSLWLGSKALPYNETCFLEIDNAHLDNIGLFHKKDGKWQLTQDIGDRLPFYERHIGTSSFVLPVSDHFLIRIKSTSTLTSQVYLSDYDGILDRNLTAYLCNGLFFGIMLAVVFYGLISSASLLDKGYLIYSVYAFLMLMFFVFRDGIAFQYFLNNYPWAHSYGVRVVAHLTGAAGVLYVITFLANVEKSFPKFKRIATIYFILAFLSLLYTVSLPLEYTHTSTILICSLSPIIMACGAFVGIKNNPMKFIFAAAIVSIIGLVYYSLSVNNLLPVSWLSNNSMKVATIVEFCLMSIAMSLQVKQIRKKREYAEKSLEKQKAIANTIEMVAHDVRKPLATAKGAFSLLRGKKHTKDFGKTIIEVESRIRLQTKSAESMLSDILEYNADMKLSLEKSSIITLVERALSETANWYRKPFNVPIEIQWNHYNLLYCDSERILRTLSNILLNACQAMRLKGTLWIKTSEENDSIRITLGNTGSFIPDSIIQKIFDAHFSHNKKKGTGLGLAVAKKTITAHNGSIEVRSNREANFVEFQIDLKTTPVQDKIRTLPDNLSSYFLKATPCGLNSPQKQNQIDMIRRFAKSKKSSIKIAILDDEEEFRESIYNIIEDSETADIISLEEFDDPNKLLDSNLADFDFIISDVDLKTELDGHDVVRVIRLKDTLKELPICLSSNRTLTSDYRRAIDSGATAFLPKPMTVDHLLKFLSDNVENHRFFRHYN